MESFVIIANDFQPLAFITKISILDLIADLDPPLVHNYSTYSLSKEQYIVLWYGLDIHVSSRINANMIYTEFEVFYQYLLKDTVNIPETDLQLIKTQVWNACEKYTEIKMPCKYRKIINEPRKRDDIAFRKASSIGKWRDQLKTTKRKIWNYLILEL